MNIPKLCRLDNNPIIYPGLCSSIGDNINGPSLIATPDWLPNRLGRYYLYFGHHNGQFIRLAYADQLEGPWQIYKPGVLPLADSLFKGHLASPDVHVDHEQQRIRLYYHGSDTETGGGTPQLTRAAVSADGLDFSVQEEILATSYMRVFFWQGYYYGLTMPGKLSRSSNGLSDFVAGHSIFAQGARHSAVHVNNGHLQVYYSRIGDSPESILYTEVDLTKDWSEWHAEPSVIVLEPERDYEGVHAPRLASVAGIADQAVWQLRDPGFFKESGDSWLLYSVAGEQGIAIAQIVN